MTDRVAVGVIGVGNMGRHHTRVYSELQEANLVGVNDVDEERAREVAAEFETRALDQATLLDRVDAVSVVVPSAHHAEVAREAIAADVHLLVEKPFVLDPAEGRDVREAALERDLVLQVGHVERYNPAVLALEDVMVETDPIAFATRRQGPPVDRGGSESVVFDLMIHDIDVVRSLADGPVTTVSAAGVSDTDHVVAQLAFADGTIATLTASRVTQERIRDLSITAEECHVKVDYMDQNVRIHRHSLPEYVTTDGDVRYRHESVIERPTVDAREPLKNELAEFLTAVSEGTQPRTTARDGIRAVELAQRIERQVTESEGDATIGDSDLEALDPQHSGGDAG